MKNRIRLDTISDVQKFVAITAKLSGDIRITDSAEKFVVSGKSLLGIMYGMSEFDNLWVVSDSDIYSHIREFIIDASAE